MAGLQIGTPGGTPERPAVFFDNAGEWRAWLEAHHESATELWMGIYKKHVRRGGLTWEEAVPEALCFGWIDSQSQSLGAQAIRQRWTPRRKGSTWSNINVAAVERLSAQGRMTPAGLAAFSSRRADRTGTYSFEQGDLELPPEFAALLAADPLASAWWAGATPGYRKVCTHWVVSAKRPQTGAERMRQLIDDSAAGRLIPSQRYGVEPAWVSRQRAALGLGSA